MQGWTATTRKRNMDILVASRNGDRIFMVSIRITSRPPSIIRKWNQSSETSQDLSWLHFDDEPRVKEKQQVKDQQSCFGSTCWKLFTHMALMKMRSTYIDIPHTWESYNQLWRNFGSVLVLSTFWLSIYSSLCVRLCVRIYLLVLHLRY